MSGVFFLELFSALLTSALAAEALIFATHHADRMRETRCRNRRTRTACGFVSRHVTLASQQFFVVCQKQTIETQMTPETSDSGLASWVRDWPVLPAVFQAVNRSEVEIGFCCWKVVWRQQKDCLSCVQAFPGSLYFIKFCEAILVYFVDFSVYGLAVVWNFDKCWIVSAVEQAIFCGRTGLAQKTLVCQNRMQRVAPL